MKTITLKVFRETVLPALKALHGDDAEALQKAMQVGSPDAMQILDEQGKALEFDEVILVSAKADEPAVDEPKAMTADEIAKAVEAAVTKALAASAKANKPAVRTDPVPTVKAIEVPARARRHGQCKNFHGPDAQKKAYTLGQWWRAIRGVPSAAKWCAEHGVEIRAVQDPDLQMKVSNEGINYQGGYLVPEESDTDIIDLREKYGVFRANARRVPMLGDTKTRSRRAGGLTAYFVGEAAAGTESTKTWDRINLVAKKIMILTRFTNELNEDAVIGIGDDLAGEIAWAFAEKEDDCGWNGDGTSTYGGIVGVLQKFLNLGATRTSISGLVVGAGNLFSELTLANFNSVVALLPEFAETPSARWYCSKAVFGVMQRLETAAGGATVTELVNGVNMKKFLGYPVVISQRMPKVDANDQVCAILGDLSLAVDFGDRAETVIAYSEHATVNSVSVFETDEVALRGTERFDINVHDIGNYTATAASKVQGPVVGLLTAAS